MFSSKVGLSEGISILDTTLFVTELSRIGVCTFLPIDGVVSIRKEESILDEFLLCNWFCEWSCCILSISLVELKSRLCGGFLFMILLSI